MLAEEHLVRAKWDARLSWRSCWLQVANGSVVQLLMVAAGGGGSSSQPGVESTMVKPGGGISPVGPGNSSSATDDLTAGQRQHY